MGKLIVIAVLGVMLIATMLTGCTDDPAPTSTPTAAPTATLTAAPTATPTATPPAAALSLDQYLSVCALLEDQDLDDASTYGEFSTALGDLIGGMSSLAPPAEVVDWHNKSLELAKFLKGLVDSQPEDKVIGTEFFAIAVGLQGLQEASTWAENDLPAEVRRQMVEAGCLEDGAPEAVTPTPTPTEPATAAPAATPTAAPTLMPPGPNTPEPTAADPFAKWNEMFAPQHWWRESEPYSCLTPPKDTSPWIEAGMTDLGGSDALSLIRFYENGSYLRYGYMGFEGCTPIKKYTDRTHLDPPIDPTYYSLGDLDITVDIARVPPDAPGWFEDDGMRETMTMTEAVEVLNAHVAPYFEKISEGKLRMRFHAGNDFVLEGEGSPNDVAGQKLRLAGVMDCRGDAADRYPCNWGAPGGLNRLLLTDVTTDTGGGAYNGDARFGLVSLREANMELLVHEMGHAWMSWPHSYAELLWHPDGAQANGDAEPPNPYSNELDFMSALTLFPVLGWHQDMPSTLAVNRYAAGWIDSEEVALHLSEAATYTLRPPRERGYQFLVVSSGRKYAFTTVEVLDERNPAYVDETPRVYDPSSPGGLRPFRYDGVLVSRYDQSTGTGSRVRFGPALWDERNPNFASDVGWGRDDYSVIQDGESRDIGGGVRLQVSRNADGSYEVSVSGGRIAEFTPWCVNIWFAAGEYDTGCTLDDAG